MRLSERALDQLFLDARSHNGWLDKRVSDELLHEVYSVARMGPTCANSNPSRFRFLKSEGAKEKLAALVTPGNRDKVMSAPVVTIIAYDLNFHAYLPRLFAHNPAMQAMYEGDPDLSVATAFRNGSLQGAYLMLAARSLGLDCGPMSGFNNAAVDTEFFADTSLKSNFLCGLGYGDHNKLFGRLPRLEFDETCEIL
jgi:3-hydroxypropanoate dehydrogenase